MGLYQDLNRELGAAKEQATACRTRLGMASADCDDAVTLAKEAGFNPVASGLIEAKRQLGIAMAQATELFAQIETAQQAVYAVTMVPNGQLLPGKEGV